MAKTARGLIFFGGVYVFLPSLATFFSKLISSIIKLMTKMRPRIALLWWIILKVFHFPFSLTRYVTKNSYNKKKSQFDSLSFVLMAISLHSCKYGRKSFYSTKRKKSNGKTNLKIFWFHVFNACWMFIPRGSPGHLSSLYYSTFYLISFPNKVQAT